MTTPALNAFERIAARFDREFEVIARIVSWEIGCEGAHRPMLEALIDRQKRNVAAPANRPWFNSRAQVC
jgi:hypothetical protein